MIMSASTGVLRLVLLASLIATAGAEACRDANALAERSAEVQAACCPGDLNVDCSAGGVPSVCTPECAVQLRTFKADCNRIVSRTDAATASAVNALDHQCARLGVFPFFQMVAERRDAGCIVDLRNVRSTAPPPPGRR